MTITSWSIIRFIHVTAATVWVGGQLVLSGIVLPALRTAAADASVDVTPLARKAAHRFALVTTLGLLPVLIATGTALAMHRGVTWDSLTRPGYGRLLAIKLALVATSFLLSMVHGILTSRAPTTARVIAAGGLGASVGIVLFATALVP